METYIQDQYEDLSTKLEKWRKKYEEDTSRRKKELETVRTARTTDLAHLRELQQRYKETKEFVDKVKAEKERVRLEKEKTEREARCALTLQSWWRGTMVRRCLGPYRKRKDLRAKLAKIQKNLARLNRQKSRADHS